MPSLSGEIFTLGADAGFEEGFVEGRVGGRAGATLALDAEVCHGINLRADIELMARIEARLRVLVPYLRAQGQAFASAGVSGQLKIDPNLFETFGLTANAEAAAEASVAGQLAIGLDAQVLADYGAAHLGGLPLRLFTAFLREVSIEAGVWGKASFSAMARAHLELNGRIFDEADAGFTLQAGYSAGLKGGCGWDFFCGVNFDSIRRFYVVAVDIITKEIVDEVRPALPDPLKPGTELIELLLPVSLHTAYDVGQRTVLGSITSPEQLIRPMLQAWAECLQRYLVDKANQLADQLLSELVETILVTAFGDELDDDARDAVEDSVRALLDLFHDGRMEAERVPEAIGHLVDIADHVADDVTAEWRRPIALFWTAMAAAHSLRDIGRATAGGDISVLGFGANIRAELRPMPAHVPDLVIEEYESVLADFDATGIDFGTAVDYLAEVGLEPLLRAHLPEAIEAIDLLADLFDLTPGDLFRDGLRGATGESWTDLETYQKLRDFCREKIDAVVLGEIMPTVDALYDGDPDVRLYLDEVARPAFRLLSDFLFDRVDAAVTDLSAIDQHPFLESTAKAVSMVMYKILARNLTVVEYIVSREVYRETSQAMGTLADHVATDRTHAVVRSAHEHLAELMPELPDLSDDQIDALQQFLAELLLAGEECFGDAIMTPQRQDRLRELKTRCLLSIAGDIDWSLDGDAFRTHFANFLTCAYIPDLDALRQLSFLQIDILSEQLAVIFRRVPPALGRLVLAATQPAVDVIQSFVDERLDELDRAYRDALELLHRIIADLEEAERLAREAAAAWERELEAMAGALDDADLPDRVLSELEKIGKDNLRAAAVDAGFSDATADVFVDTFINVTWLAVTPIARPLAAAALDAAAAGAAFFADVIDDAVNTAEARTALKDGFAALLALPDGDPPFGFSVGVTGLGVLPALNHDDLVDALWSVVKPLIEPFLGPAMTARLAEIAELERASDLTRDKSDQDTTVRDRKTILDENLPEAAPKIELFTPAATEENFDEHWTYGGEILLHLRLRHCRPVYVGAGEARRVRLFLNGVDLGLPGSAWSYDADTVTLELRRVLTASDSPLQAGINSLEVSVADGRHPPARLVRIFAADVSEQASTDFTIIGPLSQIDAPGGDHANAAEEYITLSWLGATPLALKGWRLQDRHARHVYRFPDATIAPGATIRVITGGDPAADDGFAFHWGRRAAVWNNAGDSAYLIDPDDRLRSEHVFLA